MRAWLISFLLLAGCATSAAPSSGDVLAEMRALEAERGAAIRSGDVAALERIYAADFEGLTATGVIVHRDQLFALFERTRANNAELIASSTSEVLSARREGDVIVVVGRLHFGGAESMYTHVFRRAGDHWELFAAAASPIPRAE
jgi:ketosteroid isomerase-like protein